MFPMPLRIRGGGFGCLLAWMVLMLFGSHLSAAPPESPRFEEHVRPLLKSYCFDCHGQTTQEGKLSLDQFTTTDDAIKDRALWWKVLKNLRAGVMPPAGERRPSVEELETIANWIKFTAFAINVDDPDPGRMGVRRLNRREYDNTVDDLMGIKFDAALVFPPDD